MQILLNGEKLDVQLEGESQLAEVLHGVLRWLESSPEFDAHDLQEFVLDGESYRRQPGGAWDLERFPQKLCEIGKLELFSEVRQIGVPACPDEFVQPVLIESLYALRNYFDMALQALDAKRFVFLERLFCDAAPLLELLERSVAAAMPGEVPEPAANTLPDANILPAANTLPAVNPLIGELKAGLALVHYFQGAQALENPEPSEQVRAVFQDAFLLLDELYKDYTALENGGMDALQLAASLEEQGKELVAALAQLQRGGGVRQSLHCVAELSRLLEQLLLQEDKALAGRFIELGPFLQQLGSAIEDMDMVSVSDLAEYEIVPLLEQMVASLKQKS